MFDGGLCSTVALSVGTALEAESIDEVLKIRRPLPESLDIVDVYR